MRRGDLVTIAMQGDFGKPQPALIIQADHFYKLESVTVLPITSTLAKLVAKLDLGGLRGIKGD